MPRDPGDFPRHVGDVLGNKRTLRRPINVKDDLVRMMLRLPDRARIYFEDATGNLVDIDAELIEDQGLTAPPFLVIKAR